MSLDKASLIVSFTILILASSGCEQPKTAENLTSQSMSRYLYIATGTCNSGVGVTTFSATTASNLIVKINAETGVRDSIIADYSSAPATAGDSPVGIVDWDTNTLLALILNGTSGRIERLPKTGGSRSNFGLNPGPGTILATAPRGMVKTTDGSLLILRTGFIERVNASGIRQGAPWVSNNLGATCGTANTLYTSVVTSATDSNRIIATHSATNPNNKIVSVPATGAAGSCSAVQAAPVATAYPVASVFDHTNKKLIVAFSGAATTTNINSLYAYDFDETSGSISNPQKLYDASLYPATYNYLLFGISAMTLDESTSTLYVATAISTATTVVNYSIEKFKYDSTQIGVTNANVLTRSGTVPFYNYGVDTKCISQMVVGS